MEILSLFELFPFAGGLPVETTAMFFCMMYGRYLLTAVLREKSKFVVTNSINHPGVVV